MAVISKKERTFRKVVRSIISQNIKGLRKYRYKKKENNGKDVHIIMNGPSLKDTIQYVDKIEGDIFMCNDIVKTDLFDEYSPNVYCVCDAYDKDVLRYIADALSEKNFDGSLLLTKDVFDTGIFSNDLDITVLNKYTLEEYDDSLNMKILEKNIISPGFGTVAILALYMAIQMGYKRIFLHGNDMNYWKQSRVDENNTLWFSDLHFYETKERNLSLLGVTMYDSLYSMAQIFAEYKTISDYARFEGVEIINMSLDSYIDVFQKYNASE